MEPRALALLGGLVLVLFSAPLCAIADGLGPHGSFERDAPSYMKAFRSAAAPLLDFADWQTVYHVWEIPLALGLLLVLALARPRLPPSPRSARVAAWIAWGAAALFAASTLLEGLALGDALTNVGVGGTFLTVLPALLAPLGAGLLALRARLVPSPAAWGLAAVPLLMALAVLVIPHLPGAPSVALATGWVLFAWPRRKA